MDRRSATAMVIAVILAVVLLATGAVAVVRTNQLRQAQQKQAQLERKLAEARERIEELTDGGASAEPGPGPGDEPQIPDGLGELFGEEGLRRLEDLLGELFGDQGAGGLEGMAQLASCVQETQPIEVDDDDARSQFDDIEQAVVALRDLQFTEPVEPEYLPPTEVSERIADKVEAEYEAEVADLDRRYLAAVGAIEPDLDLLEAQRDLLSGQVAGFYDSDTGEMVVGISDPDATLTPTDQATLAHELTHALTDQALGLPEVLDEELPDTDAALAALALVEGDATLVMQRFVLGALDPSERLGLALDPRAAAAQRQLEDYPYVLRQQLTFPYEQGLRFACALEQQGDREAINAAYDALPATSAQILFPERYGDPAPPPPTAPGSPGPTWTEARTDTFGAAELKWLFEAPGDDPEAALSEVLQRVARWDGGRATLWVEADATALGVVLRDGGGPGPSLCDSVTEWYERSFSDDRPVDPSAGEELALQGGFQSAVVTCPGNEVRLGAAPDIDIARAIASAG